VTSEHIQEYDDAMIALLELVWGSGYMSPGGPGEIKMIVDGVQLAGKKVLDIGCGTGGIDQFLAKTFNPKQLVGIDVEIGLIERATERAKENGLGEQLRFKCVEPGPLPFEDASFDVVFSKDAMVHIGDKETLFEEVFRVLSPGGFIVACDWMSGTDEPYSEQMTYYIKAEGLDFGMASPRRYRAAMTAAGFADVQITDRNDWYGPLAHKEHEALSGPLYERIVELVGREFADQEIEVWRALTVVVDSGELRPSHMRAHKPAA